MMGGTQQLITIRTFVFQAQMGLDVSSVAADASERFSARFTLIADRFGRRSVHFHVAVQVGFGRAQFATTITLVRLSAVVFNFVCG